MIMTEDRIRVLEMLREGKITPDAAAELLDVMNGNTLESSELEGAAATEMDEPVETALSLEDFDWVEPVETLDPLEPAPPVDALPPAEPAQPADPFDPFQAGPAPENASQPADQPPDPFDAPSGERRTPHWVRVKVMDLKSGRSRVNLRVPLSLVGLGVKIGSHFAPEVSEFDIPELIKAFQDGEVGPLVDVYDEEDGDHVEISLE